MNDRLHMLLLATRCLDITQPATMHLAISAALTGAVVAVGAEHWRRSPSTISRRSRRPVKRSLA
jgi:hypothetical protein